MAKTNLTYNKIMKSPEDRFKRKLGVRKKVFQKLLVILKAAFKKKKERRGTKQVICRTDADNDPKIF